MKNQENRKLKIPAKAALALLICASTGHASPGGISGVGGGGDPYCGHFATIGARLAQTFKMICQAPAPSELGVCKSADAFIAAVQKPHFVRPRDHVFSKVDAKDRIAVNDRDAEILLGVPKWREMTTTQDFEIARVMQVIHEYLGLARAEDGDSYPSASPLTIALVQLLQTRFISISELAKEPPSAVYTLEMYLKMDDSLLIATAQSAPIGRCDAKNTAFTLQKRNPGKYIGASLKNLWDQMGGNVNDDYYNGRYGNNLQRRQKRRLEDAVTEREIFRYEIRVGFQSVRSFENSSEEVAIKRAAQYLRDELLKKGYCGIAQ